MDFKKIMLLSVFIISVITVNFVVFAGETPVIEIDSALVVSNQQPAGAQEEKNDIQWAWGEVINLDNQAKTFTIKYLDYEADQEKELLLAIDDKTNFENIKGLDELKIKDTLSVDYTTGPDNENIAKNISLEKPDALLPPPAQDKEDMSATEVPAPGVSSVLVNKLAAPEPAPLAAELVSEPAPEVRAQAQ